MDGGFSIADLLPGLPATPPSGPPEAAQAAEFKKLLHDAALRQVAGPEAGAGLPGGHGQALGAGLGGFRPGGGDLPPGADSLPPGMLLPEGEWPEPGPLTDRPPQRRPGTDALTGPAGNETAPAVPLASGLPLQAAPAKPDTAPVPLMPRQDPRSAFALDGRAGAPALPAARQAPSFESLPGASSPLRSLSHAPMAPEPTVAGIGNAPGNGVAGAISGGLAGTGAGAELPLATPEQGNANAAALIRLDGPGSAAPGTAAAPRSLAPGQFELPLALNDARWDNAFANRVSWVVSEGMSAARLNVYPPELGQIELRVTFSNDQANVQFGVQHASVRDAVEQALPRLREMFEAAGIALGDTSVATQQQRDADPRAAGGDGEADPAAPHGDAVNEDPPAGHTSVAHHHGLIDAFV